jgi:hydroxymethylglutaryl-CoA synthase
MQAIYFGTPNDRREEMPDRYVKSVGTYLPLLRLDRKAAAAAMSWTGLGGLRTGRRAVAAWDEDALTMAVEAARGAAGKAVGTVIFASTSAPFRERLQAAILCEALGLQSQTSAADVAGSRRCAVSALRQALLSGSNDTLVAASEKRPTSPGNALHLAWGDGAVAIVAGDEGVARLIGEATVSVDLVDIYASVEHPTPYQAEERFVRDEAVELALIPAISAACAKAAIEPSRIGFAAVHEPVSGAWKAAAARLGVKAVNSCDKISDAAGDLGSAHALFGLALVLEAAQVGDIVLVAGFGSGCDAILLEVTASTGSTAASDALGEGIALANFVRFLSLTGALDIDWGPRSEVEQKTAATVLSRIGREMHGFVGGRDARGNVQFPKTLIPVSPAGDGPEVLEDVRLADLPARIVSITADRLNFTVDPPFHFGLVQFDNGARVSMEFRDVEGPAPSVGDVVRMRFRIKSMDRKRGFRTYFWKAAPSARPKLETV